jgi:hypothetical protein
MKPITDEHLNHYQVVISFRVKPMRPRDDDPVLLRTGLEKVMAQIGSPWGCFHDVTVHVRQIGSGGERSEHEGAVGLTEDIEPVRATQDVDGGGRL